MLYFLEQGPTEKTIIQQCVRQGLPLPERIANAPELYLGLELFYVGFLDLSSSRQYVGLGAEAPIDWFRINRYCKEQGIEGEQREDFFYYIQHLDSAYLDFKAKKAEKKPVRKK